MSANKRFLTTEDTDHTEGKCKRRYHPYTVYMRSQSSDHGANGPPCVGVVLLVSSCFSEVVDLQVAKMWEVRRRS